MTRTHVMYSIMAVVVSGVILSALAFAWRDGALIRALGGVPASENVLRGSDRSPQLVGYDRGAHVNTTMQADCPEGMYAGGIVVDYGGTCHHQCDPDGGVVQRIRLNCKPLQNMPE